MLSDELATVMKKVSDLVTALSEMDDPTTHPGVVFFERKPPYYVYKKAVTEILTLKEIKKVITQMGGSFISFKKERGLIGATAAVAWRPRDRTYELIAYRNGEKRWIDEGSVKEMEKRCPKTFDNYDYENRHIKIMPSSPCPVLYGVRGDDTRDLLKALKIVKSSRVKKWLIFETNQGTDEHLQIKKIGEVKPYNSVIVTGKVCDGKQTLKGGHIIFTIENEGKIDCAAYEPTKNFRKIIQKLMPNDIIVVCGGVRKKPMTINVEKIRVLKLADFYKKIENPLCKKCNKHMKSMGYRKGYRCPVCREKASEEDAIVEKVKRTIDKRWYEVPVVARRHLSKPLKRI
jgi:tRNA(Ile2)-agmatinylcytidine synthase